MVLLAGICRESLSKRVEFVVKAGGLDWILLWNNEKENGVTGDGEYDRK